IAVKYITFIPGTVYKTKDIEGIYDAVVLPSYEEMKADKSLYAKSFSIQYQNTDCCTGKPLVESYPNHIYVVQNPPQPPLTTQEMDDVYALPYMRTYHPSYEEKGGVPAIAEIKFSLISNRGCFGGCSFCALTFHQGRTIQVRSHESILEEAKLLTKDPDFKGYIHDVGGPTANFRQPSCEKQLTHGVCKNRQCLFPTPCKNMKADHSDYHALLRKLRELHGVKKVFIRSGIRFDYLLADPDDTFFKELVEHHISGQLKVAPEHISDAVLTRMGKPANAVYEQFVAKYKKMNQKLGKNQFLVPYLMSSHPGSTLKEAIELAEYLRDLGYMPEQVQDFYPTPSTISTVMYYTGLDPRDMKPVYVCRNPHEKAMQRALIQYRNPKNYDLVYEALTTAGRTDLIGFDKKCLIRPRKLAAERTAGQSVKNGKQATSKTKTAPKSKGSQNNISQTSRSQAGTRKKSTIRNIHKKK
ncbi:MAG: YgiQ family radical SAM protein, partial [Lachnospiraceae bacterium]|nr:YgiQ family radical SAM protein [Lachnospiraceae bacterium]